MLGLSHDENAIKNGSSSSDDEDSDDAGADQIRIGTHERTGTCAMLPPRTTPGAKAKVASRPGNSDGLIIKMEENAAAGNQSNDVTGAGLLMAAAAAAASVRWKL